MLDVPSHESWLRSQELKYPWEGLLGEPKARSAVDAA